MVEYISCPSCGRTLFNLEEVVHKVRNATKHLTGLDIAVMGCIVNGPGESKYADIGISLPGMREKPTAPVYMDGKLVKTLKGNNITKEFILLLEDYIKEKYNN